MKNRPLSFKIWFYTFIAALVYYSIANVLFPAFYYEYKSVHTIIGVYGFFSLALFLLLYLFNRNKST